MKSTMKQKECIEVGNEEIIGTIKFGGASYTRYRAIIECSLPNTLNNSIYVSQTLFPYTYVGILGIQIISVAKNSNKEVVQFPLYNISYPTQYSTSYAFVNGVIYLRSSYSLSETNFNKALATIEYFR